VNTRTNDEKKAKAFLAEELRKVANHTAGESSYVEPRRTRATVADLLDAKVADDELRGRKGIRQLKVKVAHVKRLLGSVRANDLRADRLSWYVQKRRAEAAAAETTIANATLDRELETIRPAFKLAGLERFAPPFERLCKAGTNARQGFIEPWEHERIVAEVPSEVLRDVCRWAWLTGARRGEILALTWGDYSEGWVVLHASRTKTGKVRKYPAEGEILEILKRRLAARVSTSPDALIFHVNGGKVGDFYGSFARACARAGVVGKTFHDYRRSAIRQMSLGGVARHLVKAFSGHTTDEVFNRYSIGSEAELRAALEAREAADAAALKKHAEGKVLKFEKETTA
jgi:integrase